MLVSFALGDANFSRFYPTRNLKVVFYPTQNPNASQWNIGCVGCQRKIFASGMYISCFLCRFHLRQAQQRKPVFRWNMGFTVVGNVFNYLNFVKVIFCLQAFCDKTVKDTF